MVKLVPILQSRAGDLGCHATGVEYGPGIYGQPFTPIQNIVRRFLDVCCLNPPRTQPQVTARHRGCPSGRTVPGGEDAAEMPLSSWTYASDATCNDLRVVKSIRRRFN